MENSRECSFGTVATAALVGGLAGVIVGLVLAPKSGRELRREFEARAETLTEQVKDSDLLEKGRQLAEDLLSFLQEFPHARASSITLSSPQKAPPPEDYEPEKPLTSE